MIGGSIVTLPFAFYQLGLVCGTGFMIFNAFLTINRAWIYLKTKDLIPGKPESMFEIGYYVLGRTSVFLISIVIFLTSFGICIVMFILVGKTMASLTKDIFTLSESSNWFGRLTIKNEFWSIFLGFCLSPIMLRKELKEMHAVSMALFLAVCILIITLFVQLCTFGFIKTSEEPNVQLTFKETIWPPTSTGSGYLLFVRSINLFVLDFAFTSNLFPVFSGLRIKTNEECIKAVSYSCLVASTIFIFTGYTTLFLFGNPMASHQNFMNSVNNEYIIDPSHWETYIIRVMFITLIVCHIPFYFFNGKEALLIIVDEIDRKSVSNTLDVRIKLLEQFEAEID